MHRRHYMTTALQNELTQLYTQLQTLHNFSAKELLPQALEYCENDREHYIEIYDPHSPRHLHLSGEGGLRGKCIPIARKVETTQVQADCGFHLRDHYAIAQLLVTERESRLVCCKYTVEQNAERSEVFSATFHAYYPITAADIDSTYSVLPPAQIRPVATQLEKDLFAQCLHAFQALRNYQNPNLAYHKAECAMQELTCVPVKQITIAGKPIPGKLVVLAREGDLCTEYLQDHNHSYRSDLLLFVAGETFHLLLGTTHIYHYFRKPVEDANAPGGCFCDYDTQVQEETYTCADLNDLPPDLIPSYY